MSPIRLIAWVPNLITLARLLSVPVVVYLIMFGYHTGAFWVFLAAGVSDALDGFFAKHFKVNSVFGAYLDPLADKALLVAVYVTLGSVDHIAVWLVILIVFRDVLIIGGAILVQTLTQSLKMEPLLVSKVNTTAQISLAGLVLARLGLGLPSAEVEFVLTFVVAATTFASGAAYVTTWVRRVATYEGES